MGHQVPTPLSEMNFKGCGIMWDGTYVAWYPEPEGGWKPHYGRQTEPLHREYTDGCFACHIASGGGDD